jgi:hypothetical protein
MNYTTETTGIWKGLIKSTTWIVIYVCDNLQCKERKHSLLTMRLIIELVWVQLSHENGVIFMGTEHALTFTGESMASTSEVWKSAILERLELRD